jgi:hypothetical protein
MNPNCGPPPKREGAPPSTPNPHESHTWSQSNFDFAFPQACAHKNQERILGLVWLAAKSLVEINGKLSDIAVLVQQQTDLVRRILQEHEGRRQS